MSGNLAWLLGASGLLSLALMWRAHLRGERGAWFRYAVASAASFTAENLADRWWPGAVLSAVWLAVLFGEWWNRRGRRAARALGAKSKALRDAVVARAREAGSPLPEGAGA